MNLGSVLSTGANGLIASSHGTQVASQNITNATTPGYTRRVANLEPYPIDQGGGVRAVGTSRVNDQFLEKRGFSARAYSGESDARVKTLAVLDSVFADGHGSVGEALDSFDSSLSDLSVTPNSTALRQVVLARADDLAQAFHRSVDALSQARSEANGHITDEVSTVNRKLDEIGDLNGRIVAARTVSQDAGDLEDKRDQLIRDISGSLPVTVLPDQSGAVTVTLEGSRTLVGADSKVHHLIASIDSTSGAVVIQRETAGEVEDITSMLNTGSIGGTIGARDGALKDALNSLDQLASDISTAYNAQHAQGVSLDGNTGRNLFEPPAATAGAALNFAVSVDVAGQPQNLAAAQDALSLPGDNRNALALMGLRDQKIGLGGTVTAQQAFTTMVAAGGSAARIAQDQADHATSALAQIDAMREASSGVSTDEEMMNLMKFQRSYQASLRVIETADSMLGDLMNMATGR